MTRPPRKRRPTSSSTRPSFELPEPGWWDVEVAVEGPHGPALVTFDFWAEKPLPRWLELWPWFAWPALVVVLFGLHQTSARRKGSPIRSTAQ